MDAPAAPKKSGPLRWILIGCGVVTLLGLLGMGGCAGIFYLIYKGSDPIAEIGADYVRKAAPIGEAVGTPVAAKRDWLGWNVQVVNDTGTAVFTYTVTGPKAAGKAEVWLNKSGGNWSPEGARFQDAKGSTGDIEIGTVPKGSRHRKDWD